MCFFPCLIVLPWQEIPPQWSASRIPLTGGTASPHLMDLVLSLLLSLAPALRLPSRLPVTFCKGRRYSRFLLRGPMSPPLKFTPPPYSVRGLGLSPLLTATVCRATRNLSARVPLNMFFQYVLSPHRWWVILICITPFPTPLGSPSRRSYTFLSPTLLGPQTWATVYSTPLGCILVFICREWTGPQS